MNTICLGRSFPLDAYVGDLMVFLSRIWHKVNPMSLLCFRNLGGFGRRQIHDFSSFPDEDYRVEKQHEGRSWSGLLYEVSNQALTWKYENQLAKDIRDLMENWV
ncbi:unnamed protein product [Sphenostylis stenocarpa]|uniref:Uncharacterized protein n=1 Tax=Sphenostylis stenocarpa TaxID=92480 RepID=A0AA86SRV1_9FABA|nr:unnamed protein product [Sphenostylis stenocarpa]